MFQRADYSHRVGGAVGRHAIRTGHWFDPTTWSLIAAVITWLVVMARQVPCRPIVEHFPDQFMRLCYSDIPTLYLGRGISTGAGLYTEVPLEYPVLTGYFIEVARAVTKLLGGNVASDTSYADQVAASQIFFQVCAVGLFICFAATVLAHLRMADPGLALDRPAPARAWDALLLAASPVVMANALINWDMLVVMLTALGMLVWSRRHPFASGLVFGLAFAAKFYPVLVLVAITLLCVRAHRYRALVQVWVGACAAWLVVNAPMIILARDGWSEFWTMNAGRGADLGSFWYVLQLIGIQVPALSAVAFLCMAVAGIALTLVVLRAPRRPRLAQVALLLLLIFLIFNKVYSPQYALWLLPLMVLARPVLGDLIVWTLGELFYFVCIWGFLGSAIGPGSNGEWVYWAAVFARICIQVWFGLRVLDDIAHPWEDPVRRPLVDDPIGGVLDHAPDARWLLALSSAAHRRGRAHAVDEPADQVAAVPLRPADEQRATAE